MKVLLGLVLLLRATVGQSLCTNLMPSEGELVYRTSLLFYSLVYPHTFTVKLNAGNRCFFISNNIIEGQWSSPDIQGTIYMYGFDGYDGRNKNTCRLYQTKPFNKDYMYYTGDSSYPLADLSDGRFSHVCSYIVLIENLGSQYDYVTFGKLIIPNSL